MASASALTVDGISSDIPSFEIVSNQPGTHVNIVGIPSSDETFKVLPIAESIQVVDQQIVIAANHSGPAVISVHFPKNFAELTIKCGYCTVALDQLPFKITLKGDRIDLSAKNVKHIDIKSTLVKLSHVVNVEELSIRAHSWISENTTLSMQRFTVHSGVCYVRGGTFEITQQYEHVCRRTVFAPRHLIANSVLFRSRRARFIMKKARIGLLSLSINKMIAWLGSDTEIETWQGVVSNARIFSVLPRPKFVQALGSKLPKKFNLFSLGQKHLPYFSQSSEEDVWLERKQTPARLRISIGYFSQISPKVLTLKSDSSGDGQEKGTENLQNNRMF